MYRVLLLATSFIAISGHLLHADCPDANNWVSQQDVLMGSLIFVPVSIGEMIDKITILQIKASRFTDEIKRFNVLTELRALECVLGDLLRDQEADMQQCTNLTEQLHEINEMLWEIEDAIRAKEAELCFDEQFIELARSVYFTNDERGRVKKALNNLFHSALTEEKTYTSYAK